MHPWRDIYSSADLMRIRSTWPRLPMLPEKPSIINKLGDILSDNNNNNIIIISIKQPSDAINQLIRYIECYHIIPKTKLNRFSQRMAELRVIGRTANDCLKMLTDACNSNNNANVNTARPKADKKMEFRDKEKDPYSILRSISHRAERKSDYLFKIQEYFSLNSKLSTTAGLLEYLTEESNSESGTLQVVKRNRLEVVDPFHRNYEIEFNNDGKPERKQSNAISCAFAEWFDELGSGKNVPHFFIWLEGHSLCTSSYSKCSYDDKSTYICDNDARPKNVHEVKYSPDGLYALCFKEGMVMYSEIGTSNSGLFDTSNAIDSKKEGAYAFVLTKSGDIISAPHVGGKLHHSTLAMGKSVQCAGMIKARQGKIYYISNNSGHYQPPEANLREVVHILSINNVLAQGAQVEVLSHSEPKLYRASDFVSSKPTALKTDLKPRRINQPVIRP